VYVQSTDNSVTKKTTVRASQERSNGPGNQTKQTLFELCVEFALPNHLGLSCIFNTHRQLNKIYSLVVTRCSSRHTSKFCVTMDSKEETAQLVHFPNTVMKFKQMSNGLYAMNPTMPESYGKLPNQYQMIHTIKENMTFLTPRQQKRALRARALYHATGMPVVDDLKAMIRMNLIWNNIVTTEDVNLATKAYGVDIGTIKGKTTRKRPAPAMSNLVEIPDELLEVQKDVILSIDGMTVNSLKFLTTISHELFYWTAQCIPTNVESEYEKCMDELMAVYRRGQFTVNEVHCNNEFHKLMDPYFAKQDPPITMNYMLQPRSMFHAPSATIELSKNEFDSPINSCPTIIYHA
jgi:hypothetical protein